MKRLHIVLLGVAVTALTGLGAAVHAWQEAASAFPPPDLNHPQAAFMFTHQYAVANGATDEWRKQEGTIIDAQNRRLYMAVSRVDDIMSDGQDDIRLQDNLCGMVLVGTLDADWNVTQLQPLLIGGPFDRSTGLCALDNIANPDNLFLDDHGDLWIYEDSDYHISSMVWKYSPADGTLRRFATAPQGGN